MNMVELAVQVDVRAKCISDRRNTRLTERVQRRVENLLRADLDNLHFRDMTQEGSTVVEDKGVFSKLSHLTPTNIDGNQCCPNVASR